MSGSSQTEPPASARPKGSIAKWLLKGTAVGLTGLFAATVGVAVTLMMPLPRAIAPARNTPLSLSELWEKGLSYQITRPVHILVMGIDLPLDLPEHSSPDDVFAGRSDTMLLVRIDPGAESLSVLSIPRDTRVEIPGEGIEKVNYANMIGGSELAAQVVSQSLNSVTIDRYVRVSTEAFRDLVDVMGGIEVFVPERMEYEDQTQELYIDLYPGWQVLNGDQAEQFARFRNDENGDIGRVQRQQQLIRALRKKLSEPTMLTRIPQVIQLFQKYVDTNLTPEEMFALANFGLNLEQDNFRMVLLPGRFSTPDEYVASYWLMDPVDTAQVMHQYFDLSSIATLSQQQYDYDLSELRIAIQNASDDPDLGGQVAAYLYSKGYYNVYVVEDWPDHEVKTQIIAQRGDLRGARMLGSVLGVGQIVPASTGELTSDLTIRLGDDWLDKHRI
ncbi:LCP family protein [Egbenema bharatensis]|uniref:LCP family protein n=1 Tax=Egbenema bharatensis TaxID=3463334 RepID=UPI003A836E62